MELNIIIQLPICPWVSKFIAFNELQVALM